MRKQRNIPKRTVLGVTGSFGSGKSTVARHFVARGGEIIDADKIARRLLKPGSQVSGKILAAFGRGILGSGGRIDRAKLAGIVFSKRSALKKLNTITHPQIIRQISLAIKKSRAGLIVLDAPLLLEAGLRGSVDTLVVVKVSRAKQIERLKARGFLNKEEILKRIKIQLPLSRKLGSADFVIDNNGSKGETKKQVEKIRQKIVVSRPR
jgi:dephospho-CoA kinase